MSQISLPVRILLIGAVVFMAAWFTVLKPGDPAEPAATATAPAAPTGPESAAGDFKAKAKAGAATAEADATGAANAGIGEDGTTAVTPAPSAASPTQTGAATRTAPAPALPELSPESLKGLPKALRTGLRERKVVVLGVLNTQAKPWAPMADDDRAVRNVLRDVNRYRGGVVVRTAPLTRLARYDGLLSALQVTQSPTVVVVDRNRRAVALTGYVDRLSVNQAIADARDSSTARRIKDPYLRRFNDACGRIGLRTERFSLQTVRGARRQAADRLVRVAARNRRSLARIAAPARWRGLRDQALAEFAVTVATTRDYRRALLAGDRRAARRIYARDARLTPAERRLDRRFNATGLTACVSNRTR